MTHRSRLVRVVALALVLLIGGSAPPLSGLDGQTAVASADPPMSVSARQSPLAEAVDWALRVFDGAGLALPDDLEISLDPSGERCGTRRGLYERSDPPRVTICASADSVLTRRLLLHELAHAWDDANLTAIERSAFQEHAGLSTWWSHDEDWGARGAEHAAETIAWGVLEGPGRLASVGSGNCLELAADYELLTGTPPPAGLPDGCVRAPVEHPVMTAAGIY